MRSTETSVRSIAAEVAALIFVCEDQLESKIKGLESVIISYDHSLENVRTQIKSHDFLLEDIANKLKHGEDVLGEKMANLEECLD